MEWLDKVPAHWGVLPCRAVVEEKNEKNEAEADQRYLSLMANVGIIPYEEKGDVGNKKPEDLSKCKLVAKGDLVINSMNYGIGSYGLSALDGVCSPVYIVLRPRLDRIESRFALRVFENKAFQTYAQSFGNGILEHRAAINWDILKVIGVGVPPMAEQLEILTFLDRETGKIDALIAEQEKLLALLAEKRQATISHAVTRGLNPNAPIRDSGIPWLGEVPAHWEVTRLKFIASVQTGIAKGKDTTGKDTINVPYLRVANVQDGHLALVEIATIDIEPDQLERYRLQRGDVLMNEGGDFDKLGRGALWNGEIDGCIHQNHVFAVRPHGVSPQWLNQVTSSQYAQFYFMGRSKQSTNLASISSTNIMELPVLLPPAEEQEAILRFVENETSRLHELQEAAQHAINLLKERRSALIAAAVTGKIDVRGPMEAQVA
ncbi:MULTISPECIES: restriction endonuclease subunit S [unclassified Rhodanobacter]|uniref:Restriction endonuclease subunit S n=1 Tax=Rhodanobacter humi TaxID=1888173 RepID=A0ABV4AVA3_9GAMM